MLTVHFHTHDAYLLQTRLIYCSRLVTDSKIYAKNHGVKRMYEILMKHISTQDKYYQLNKVSISGKNWTL